MAPPTYDSQRCPCFSPRDNSICTWVPDDHNFRKTPFQRPSPGMLIGYTLAICVCKTKFCATLSEHNVARTRLSRHSGLSEDIMPVVCPARVPRAVDVLQGRVQRRFSSTFSVRVATTHFGLLSSFIVPYAGARHGLDGPEVLEVANRHRSYGLFTLCCRLVKVVDKQQCGRLLLWSRGLFVSAKERANKPRVLASALIHTEELS